MDLTRFVVLLLVSLVHFQLISAGHGHDEGCPEGYEQLVADQPYCYKAILEPMTWAQGRRRCQEDDPRAHLAYVLGSDQNDAIVGYLERFKGTSQCYISGAEREIYYLCGQRKELNNCDLDEFVWRVDSKKSIPVTDYTNFKEGEPNCYGGLKENCLIYRCEDVERTCYWNDYYCAYNACLLCQIDL